MKIIVKQIFGPEIWVLKLFPNKPKTYIMKKILAAFVIIVFSATVITSCTKSELNSSSASQTLNPNSNVKPPAPYCGPGNYFDFYLGKCVPVCQSGYHNDSVTGACVITPVPMTNSAMLDSAGAYHNEYQAYMLNLIVQSTISLEDTQSLKTFIYNNSANFFKSKGITDNGFTIIFSPVGMPDTISVNTSNYSANGGAIMLQLQSLVNNYNQANDASFYSSLNTLEQQALSLSGNEPLTVGIPISIAINSFKYWEANYSTWNSLITTKLQQQSPSSLGAQKLLKLGLGSLGAADVGGAIRGGIAGVELGPGGVFAGAVLGSATYSLANVCGQVIGHFFSWW